jgi:hypothetical protein
MVVSLVRAPRTDVERNEIELFPRAPPPYTTGTSTAASTTMSVGMAQYALTVINHKRNCLWLRNENLSGQENF